MKVQNIGSCDFTTPILSDTPRDMLGRAERVRTYLDKIGMNGRNVVTVLGDSHVFVSSLEPFYSDWCGSGTLGFIDAFKSGFDSAFIKGFLAKSATLIKKERIFGSIYLEDVIGSSNKEILVACLREASKEVNGGDKSPLYKTISKRMATLSRLSGHAFFKELVEVIESANIKLSKVSALGNGSKIKEFNIISIWQLASEILTDMDALGMEEPQAMKIMSSYISSLILHIDFLNGLIGKTRIRVSDAKGAHIERNLGTELI